MKELVNTINEMCGTNGTTTINEVAKKLNISYGKAHYWIHKYYKIGLLGILYPGLGMSRNSERFIYNKCCTLS